MLVGLPERDQEARLDALARRLEEDPAAVREEFALSTSLPPEPRALSCGRNGRNGVLLG
jgi:hypothetical protein